MPRKSAKFVAEPFDYHEEIEVEITSLTNQGVGVGRVDGWVVMIPFALPGETVTGQVFRNYKNYSEADLVEVKLASPHRVDPVCPLFGECGGCQYQNLDYAVQLGWKGRQVQELLERMIGVEMDVLPVMPSPRQYNYRSKITPHFNKQKDGGVPPIGFLKKGRRFEVIDVKRCPLATEAINAKLPEVREAAQEAAPTMKKGATLLLRDSLERVVTDHAQIITEKVGDLKLQFPAGNFFQNNPFILPELVGYVRDEASADGTIRNLVDAYCGSGLFALGCASAFDAVAGVEISETSIEWARRNAEANSISNCEFVAGDASAIFAGLRFAGEDSTVIIDPPRKGSNAEFLQQLFEFGPTRVVYVSCNPATQMRDLKEFLSNGYRLEKVQPFDLFPQTKHLECVITLTRL